MIKNETLYVKIIFRVYLKIKKISQKYFKFLNRFFIFQNIIK